MLTAERVARPKAIYTFAHAPDSKWRIGRLACINAYWFGRGAHWRAILVSLLFVGATLVASKDTLLLQGRVMTAGSIFALLVPILAGWLSDRTASRWGRRRPWMVAGTAVNLIGLGLLAVAGTPLLLLVGFVVVQASNNAAEAAYAGVIPDVVPADHRGRASSLLGVMELVGSIFGLAAVMVVFAILGQTRLALIASYAILGVILVIGLIIAVLSIQEPPVAREQPRPRLAIHPFSLACSAAFLTFLACLLALLALPLGSATVPVIAAALVAGATSIGTGWQLPAFRAFVSPFKSNDFFWVFATRTLVTLGLVITVGFMPYYFRDIVGVANSALASSAFGLTVVISAAASALLCGSLSDRAGCRKAFVYLSSGIQAAVVSVLVFGLVGSIAVIFGLGVIFGIGFGAYTAVDWALACDVLPDRKRAAGKDMGLWHASLTLPTVVGPALLALLLYHLNQPGHWVLGLATGGHLGFRVAFGLAAMFYILGTVMVARIRGVR